MKKVLYYFLLLMLLIMPVRETRAQVEIYDSGGPLMPEQAAYDVTFYDLQLTISPADSSIAGSVVIDANIVQPLIEFVFDLDSILNISMIKEVNPSGKEINREFTRSKGRVFVPLKRTRQPGERISIQVSYGGRPHIAKMPPWSGGLTWEKTADGSPWIATSCQEEGADIWWPNKDHISDKPDSMALHIRVPDPLVCASNGRLISVQKHNDMTSTYHWFVSMPISNYNVALNIAPYRLIESELKSVAGDIIPVKFWVLPEDYEKGQHFMSEIIAHLKFYEQNLGPYPFRADKYGVVQTPHLGMEHQTIIAYGAGFKNDAMIRKDWGFDALHHHELSHEWFGNMVTCADWRDIWLHEGFGSYMQAVYLEQTQGIERYHAYMKSLRRFREELPVAPRESRTASQAFEAPVYNKGAWVLHTLRYLVGDSTFKIILRRMAYPDPGLEKITDGAQIRFVSTDDLFSIAEEESGMELAWFAEVYLRRPELPMLNTELSIDTLKLNWEVANGLKFPMPVDIYLDGRTMRVEIPQQGVSLPVRSILKPVIDPDNWVLRKLE